MIDSINLLYISTAVTPNDMKIIEHNKIKGTSNGYIPIYKYHNAIIDGLNSSEGLNISSLIVPPVTSNTSHMKRYPGSTITANNVKYVTLGFINNKLIKYFTVFYKIILSIFSWYKSTDNKRKAIIIDGAFISGIIPWYIINSLLQIPTIFIIADVYDFMNPNKKKTILNRFYRKAVSKAKGFAFITTHTNTLINSYNKPYLLVEGIVNSSYIPPISLIKEKFCMYAGSLHAQNGVGNLVEAFKSIDTDYELRIYGSGDMEEYLKELSLTHKNIVFKGVKPIKEILMEETKASFLINPRPINEEFTKYSFPSKIIEYLLSGTPLISSKLPGIPEEYNEYINYIDVSSQDKFTRELEIILTNDKEKYLDKALLGREWIINNKNSKAVGEKFINVINQVL